MKNNMTGLYITKEGQRELEAIITDLAQYNDEPEKSQLAIYRKIYESAELLPSTDISIPTATEMQQYAYDSQINNILESIRFSAARGNRRVSLPVALPEDIIKVFTSRGYTYNATRSAYSGKTHPTLNW